jgi:transposase
MTSKQQKLRERVVQYYESHYLHGKLSTVRHFHDEGVSKRTIYNILQKFAEKKTVARKSGSGRKAKIMTKRRISWLQKKLSEEKHPSTRVIGRKLNCSQSHVVQTIQKHTDLVCKKKIKGPKYSPLQTAAVKKACRALYNLSQGKSLVVDDEKYFSLSGCHMPGNTFYYNNKNSTSPLLPHQVKTKVKFEPKVMLWIAISEAGLSKPYLVPSGMAVKKELYIKECLEKRLIPFLNEHHVPGSYLFWPDKASSHYARATQDFLAENNIPLVPRNVNPTNLPQCRPIEDYFGQLAQKVYEGGWSADSTEQLRRRILQIIRTMDSSSVQCKCGHIRGELRKCYVSGPYKCLH